MQSSTSIRQKRKCTAFLEKYGTCIAGQSRCNYQVSEIGRSTLAKLNYAVFEQLGVASSWPKVEKDLLLYGSSAFTSDGLDVEIWV